MRLTRLLLLVTLAGACRRGPTPTVAMSELGARYQVFPNLEYRTVGDWRGKLDLYLPARRTAKTPTLVWFHGGAWASASKEEELLYVLPYLERGWSVVNVEYRLASVARAPAAVDDCRCALGWVFDAGRKYRISTDTVVVSGISAGGHLALMAVLAVGPMPVGCQAPGRVSALVNWFGPSDLSDLSGKAAAMGTAWLDGVPARKMSPIAAVRPGEPPIITVHGADDDLVPYRQSVALHRALTKAGVKNRLVKLAGGHGFFPRAQWEHAWAEVWRFLDASGDSSPEPGR